MWHSCSASFGARIAREASAVRETPRQERHCSRRGSGVEHGPQDAEPATTRATRASPLGAFIP